MASTKRKKKPSSSKKQSNDSVLLGRLERLVKMMEKHQLAHLEWEEGSSYVCLKTNSCFTVSMADRNASRFEDPLSHPSGRVQNATHVSGTVPQGDNPQGTPSNGNGGAAAGPNQVEVLAPLVGTFYRAPSPNASPYKSQGDSVSRGDTICIIEAMKLMNEIESEYSGRVVAVLAEDGQPVEYGEPIFIIEKS